MGSGLHGGSMAVPPVAALDEKIASASSLYHRAIFLVGAGSDARSGALAELGGKHGWPVVNLGLAFSQQLLDVPRRHRAVSAPQVLADLFDAVPGDAILLDHIEVLFTPELAQDPVRLLQGLSRNRPLVVSWPGARDGTTLLYGDPGHPEYYKQAIPDLVHVEMAGAAQPAPAQ